MQQSVEMLLKRMGEDKTFAEKVLSQTEKEMVIEIAKEEGIELTMEDIDEANEIIVKSLLTENEGELSEEDLETVAGGFGLSGMISPIITQLTSVMRPSTSVTPVTPGPLPSPSVTITTTIEAGNTIKW